MKEFKPEDIGPNDLQEVSDVCKWHRKKYAGEPKRTYMFCDDHSTCSYTFTGSTRLLKFIDRFVRLYRIFFNH